MTSTGQHQLPECIEKLKWRFADPAVNASLKSYTKTFQISLTDLNEDYLFTIKDGELVAVEKKHIPNPDLAVTVASTLMDGILSKTSNGILAYFTGKLKIRGTRDDILRLQKLLG